MLINEHFYDIILSERDGGGVRMRIFLVLVFVMVLFVCGYGPLVRRWRKRRIRDLEEMCLSYRRGRLTEKLTTVDLDTMQMYPDCLYVRSVKHDLVTMLSPEVLRIMGYHC